MNFPIIPTDNLYKFIAIFGLVLLIFTNTILPNTFKIENQEKFNQNTSYISETEDKIIELKKLQELTIKPLNKVDKIEIRKLSDLRDPIIERETMNYKTRIKSIKYINVDDELEKSFEKLKYNIKDKKLLETIRLQVAEIQFLYDSIDSHILEYDSLYKKQSYIKKFLNVFSYIVMCLGFYLWYDNTQKYQDMILKEQAKKYVVIEKTTIIEKIKNLFKK